jgi:hypothetical protein
MTTPTFEVTFYPDAGLWRGGVKATATEYLGLEYWHHADEPSDPIYFAWVHGRVPK